MVWSFDYAMHQVKCCLRPVLAVTGLLGPSKYLKPHTRPLRSALQQVYDKTHALFAGVAAVVEGVATSVPRVAARGARAAARRVPGVATLVPVKRWLRPVRLFLQVGRQAGRNVGQRGLTAARSVPRRVRKLPMVWRELVCYSTCRIYGRNWYLRAFGSYSLQTRRRMEALPPAGPPARSRSLRVFQGLYATVQPVLLGESFRKAGLDARYETLDYNPAFTKPDTVHTGDSHPDLYFEHVHFERGNLMGRRAVFIDDYSLNRLFDFFVAQRTRYDVFHFNWFLSFLPDNVDVEQLRRDGKAVYFHFRGCFILSTFLTDQFTKRGGGIADACRMCKDRGWRDKYFDRFYRAVSFSHRVFVSTPNLCHCSSEFEYVPLSLDPELARLPEPTPRPAGQPVRVLHCVGGPGHYAVKGTDHIRKAVDVLRNEGLAVELEIIEQMSREAAVKRFGAGDILVEQLNLGAYGNVAIEAMAHGLPVISSLDPAVAHLIPDCPIVHATPTTLVARLRELVVSPERRQELGRRCYRFVRTFHDNDRIAEHLAGIYRVDLGLERAKPKNTIENRSPNYA